MIVFVCCLAYVVVGTVIGTVSSHVQPAHRYDDPTPVLLGAFWPFSIPIAITVVLTKRVLRRVDQWREAKEKERRELTERLAELEADLAQRGVFERRD